MTVAFLSVSFDLSNSLGIFFNKCFPFGQQSVDSDRPFALGSPTTDGRNNQSLKHCYVRNKTMDEIKKIEKFL